MRGSIVIPNTTVEESGISIFELVRMELCNLTNDVCAGWYAYKYNELFDGYEFLWSDSGDQPKSEKYLDSLKKDGYELAYNM